VLEVLRIEKAASLSLKLAAETGPWEGEHADGSPKRPDPPQVNAVTPRRWPQLDRYPLRTPERRGSP